MSFYMKSLSDDTDFQDYYGATKDFLVEIILAIEIQNIKDAYQVPILVHFYKNKKPYSRGLNHYIYRLFMPVNKEQ